MESTHNILMSERKTVSISGVSDVINFDENSVVLATKCGSMEIEGTELHVVTLNVGNGEIKVEGTINGIFYYNENEKTKTGFFGRMFK